MMAAAVNCFVAEAISNNVPGVIRDFPTKSELPTPTAATTFPFSAANTAPLKPAASWDLTYSTMRRPTSPVLCVASSSLALAGLTQPVPRMINVPASKQIVFFDLFKIQ